MKNIFFLFSVLSLCVFSSCKKCKDCSCSQVISQTGSPDITQNVEFNDVCDEDLENRNYIHTKCGRFISDH